MIKKLEKLSKGIRQFYLPNQNMGNNSSSSQAQQGESIGEFRISLGELEKVQIKPFSLQIKSDIKSRTMQKFTGYKDQIVGYIRCLPTYYEVHNLTSLKQTPSQKQSTIITSIKSYYNYDNSVNQENWWANFADTHLFGFYHTKLYAQDEMQCTEFPHLPHLREYAESKKKSQPNIEPLTIDNDLNPTPVLVTNVPRLCAIDILPTKEHPKGFYGNQFRSITGYDLDQRMQNFDSPVFTNILAIAALGYHHGNYTNEQIQFTLNMALVAFHRAKEESKEKKCVIHTSNWGCGAFGNNKTVIASIQIYAARLANVDELVYYKMTEDEQVHINEALENLNTNNTLTQNQFINLLIKKKYKWGMSNGT